MYTPAAQDDRQASDMVKTSASVLRSRLFIPLHMVHRVVPVAILPPPLRLVSVLKSQEARCICIINILGGFSCVAPYFSAY